MTATVLKLVPDNHVDNEINEIAGGISASKKALIKGNGGKGPFNADLLPPDEMPLYDDLANSKRFLSIIGDDLLYCAESKKWLNWLGTHWEVDKDDFVFDLAADFARSMYNEPGGYDPKSSVYKNAQRANNRSGFNAFIELSQRKVAVSIDALDAAETNYFLNCSNGTLDLRTGKLRDHERTDRITRLVNIPYEPDAASETFNRFLWTIQPDAAIRAFLQRSIGYSLLGSVRERSFWILYGTGNNGKSVFTNLFNNILGEYASTTPASSIMASKQSAIPNDIARLKGKRFIVVPETEENERLQAALVKALSAGDKISARFLFGEYFDFYFSGKLWIATNHKPTITDHSKGFWDRCKLVPFSVDIPQQDVDRDIMSKLMADAPAALAWAVQGARDYFEADGLDVPPVIQAEIDAYKFEQDSIAQFIEEHLETAEQWQAANPDEYMIRDRFKARNPDVYALYEKFCKENGEYKYNQRRLSQNLKARGFTQQPESGVRTWNGFRLTNEV